MTTVRASVAVIERIGASGEAEFATPARVVLFVSKRFQEKITSSMSSARPLIGGLLWNLTPGRIFSVIERPSGENSHDSARSGPSSFSDGFR